MRKIWAFIHGLGQCAFFALPKASQYYPYTFPEEALTRDWETVGHDIRRATKAYQGKQPHE